MKKRVNVYSKETLLVYLINELSSCTNYEVITILDDDNCWNGEIHIKETSKQKDDDCYYKTLVSYMR